MKYQTTGHTYIDKFIDTMPIPIEFDTLDSLAIDVSSVLIFDIVQGTNYNSIYQWKITFA